MTEPTITLSKLIEFARGYRMTEAERRDQRISFAYGNVAIENPQALNAANRRQEVMWTPGKDGVDDDLMEQWLIAVVNARQDGATPQVIERTLLELVAHLSAGNIQARRVGK